MSAKKIKRAIYLFFYAILAVILNPTSIGLDPYINSPTKKAITQAISANDKAAVFLRVSGLVSAVGYLAWLKVEARLNNLDCWGYESKSGFVKTILVGPGPVLEDFIQIAWRGPKRSRVEAIREYWFNRPVKTGDSIFISKKMKKVGVSWSQSTADSIKKALIQVEDITSEPNKFTCCDNYERLVGTDELQRAATERNLINLRLMKKEILIVSPFKQIGLQRSQTTRVSTITYKLTDHKQLTKDYLSCYGLPVPEGKAFQYFKKAKEYFNEKNIPMVVKPAIGLNGTGVTVDVRNDQALQVAWEYACKYDDTVILEELVEGVDIRVVVIGGVARSALLRIPANIVGDGENKISALLHQKNRLRATNPRLSKNLIIPDAYSDSYLQRQGYTWDSIPKCNEVVFLHLKANICKGADSISITDRVHPDLMKLAEEAAKVFGIDDYWGIDLLVGAIDQPRNQRHCSIVELNSTANIENVIYPLYGSPFDSARCFIDYMFPEGVLEHEYPELEICAVITGVFDDYFFEWNAKQIEALNLRLQLQSKKTKVTIHLSGRQNNIWVYLYNLLDWKLSESSFVTGLLIKSIEEFNNQDNLSKNELISRGTVLNPKTAKKDDYYSRLLEKKYNKYPLFEKEILDVDLSLLSVEFATRGYEANVLCNELIEIKNEALTGMTSLRHSTLFSDRVCEKIYPVKTILSINGLPVLRSLRLTPKKKSLAIASYHCFGEKCILTSMRPKQFESFLVESEEDLIKRWGNARDKGTKSLLIEEYITGWFVGIVVINGTAKTALVYEPLNIAGDGFSSIRVLIQRKNEARLQNPYYLNKQIVINEQLIDVLNYNYHSIDDILDDEKKLFLEDYILLEQGGETIGVKELLHQDFYEQAEKVISAIPGLEFAQVNMIIPRPDLPESEQRWVVYRINTCPSIAEFHYPMKGVPFNLAECVVDELCLTNRTKWIKSN